MIKEEMCKCGHSKCCHAVGIGGCFHTDGKPRSLITNFDDVTCDCNKFVKHEKGEVST